MYIIIFFSIVAPLTTTDSVTTQQQQQQGMLQSNYDSIWVSNYFCIAFEWGT